MADKSEEESPDEMDDDGDDGKSPDENLHWIRIRSGLPGTLGLSTSAD